MANQNSTNTGKTLFDNSLEIWNVVCSHLKPNIPQEFFETLFKEIEPIQESENTIVLSSQNKKILSHIEKYYGQLIHNTIQKFYNTVSIKYKVELPSSKSTKNTGANGNIYKNEQKRNIATNTHSYQANNRYQNKQNNFILRDIPLNSKYTFERFISGSSNEHALAACKEVAKEEYTINSPLYIYGNVGLGKTHLMVSIGNYINKNYPWVKVKYVPSEVLQSDLIEAFRSKTMHHFHYKYRTSDILLIDDIQFISKNAVQTQEAIFNIFNYLYQHNKKIVISADTLPKQLSSITSRLKSRFQSGLIVEIKEPNLETRIKILMSKAKEMKIDLTEKQLRYIGMQIPKQIRALESILIKIDFMQRVNNCVASDQLIESCLKDLIQHKLYKKHIDTNDILWAVSNSTDVSEQEILGECRTRPVVLARQLCMYLCRKLAPSKSLCQIAKFMNKKDHATVLNACEKIKRYIDENQDFANTVQEIVSKLEDSST